MADLDGDGPREITFASWNDSLYVIRPDGSLKPGFPRGTGQDLRGGAVVGDLDRDGTMEIVVGGYGGGLYVFDHDGGDYVPGGLMAVLPAQNAGGIALGNVDADPELEIFVGCLDGDLYAFHHDGASFLPGQGGIFAALPVGPIATDGITAAPIIVDVDGDGDFEILVGHRNFNFYGWHHDGTTVLGLPIPTGNNTFSTAAAGDVDGDGDVDVAFASYDATINVIDFPGASTPEAYEWPTYGGNNFRTAAYGDLGPDATGAGLPPGTRFLLTLEPNTPNPFPGATRLGFVVPRTGPVELRVFDVSGRLVRTLVSGSVPAGRNAVQWDGRDGRGRVLSSGIYFFRLDDGQGVVTRKGVLLR